jgi:hypothetical protein
VPFRPKHMREFSQSELKALESLNLSNSPGPAKENGSPVASPLRNSQILVHPGLEDVDFRSQVAKKVDLEALERKAEVVDGELNGH